MSEPRIAYTVHPDAKPEAEVFALAAIYKFALGCHANKVAVPESHPDDARKGQDALTKSHCK